jgi:hypothetical protein
MQWQLRSGVIFLNILCQDSLPSMQSRPWVTNNFSSRRMLNALSGGLNLSHDRVVIPAQSSTRVANQIILEDLWWFLVWYYEPWRGDEPWSVSYSRLINTNPSLGGMVNTNLIWRRLVHPHPSSRQVVNHDLSYRVTNARWLWVTKSRFFMMRGWSVASVWKLEPDDKTYYRGLCMWCSASSVGKAAHM